MALPSGLPCLLPRSIFELHSEYKPPTTELQQLHLYSVVPSLLLPWNLSRSSRGFQETVWKSAYNKYLTQLAPICFAVPQINYFFFRRSNSSPRHTSNSSGFQAFSSRGLASTPISLGRPPYPLCKSFLALFFLDSSGVLGFAVAKIEGLVPREHPYLMPSVSVTKVGGKSRHCRPKR